MFEAADPFGDLYIIVKVAVLDDDTIKWCRDEWCPKHKNLQTDVRLCDALLELTLAERWAVYLLAGNPQFDPTTAIDWICVSPKAGTTLAQRTGNELKLVYPQQGLHPQDLTQLSFDHYFLQHETS